MASTAQTVHSDSGDVDSVMSLPQFSYTIAYQVTTPKIIHLITNKLFCARIIIFLITVILLLLTLCYAFGQILTVELSDFWCKPTTLEEVRAHSKEIGSNVGEYNSCWNTKGSYRDIMEYRVI